MAKKRKQNIFSLKNILFVVLFLAVICFGAGLGLFIYYAKDAPQFDPNKLRPSATSFVLDESGNVIAELHGEQNRVPVTIDKVPQDLINAYISIEDQHFFSHRGINIRSIVGAVWTDITHGGIRRGASTITQQIVKNAFLNPEKTLKRKAQEAWLAIQLERHYPKEKILEFYLNQIYFGHSAYGVQAAANTYFGKDVDQLDLAECAMIAGISNSPLNYSPYLNFENAKRRQAIVLNTMVDMGYLTQDEAENAKKEELQLVGLKNVKADYKAPYFTDYVVRTLAGQLQKEYGITADEAFDRIYSQGLKIYTTVDLKTQEAAEKALASPQNYPYSKNDKQDNPQPQAAAVVIDPHTGYIKAMVGGREHKQRLGFNRADQAYRQPGSAFKPIVVYTAAVDMGYTPATVVDDSPVSYSAGSGKSWTPKNYTNDYKGLTTIRTAIAKSVNVVAVKVLNDIGIDRGIEYAQRLGIENLVLTGSKNDRQLSVALGGITKGVTPLELASAYGTLANSGVHVEPIAILKVEDKSGRVVLENKPNKSVAVSEQVAFIMTNMLESVVKEGTGHRLSSFPYPVAGKTGTTTDDKDVWFVGYTPHLVAAVWMGHDEPTGMSKVAGGLQPALMWKQIMTEAHQKLPNRNFERPNGIVGPINICIDSGQLPSELCYKDPRGSRIRGEFFIKGTEPTAFCNVHVQETIDSSTGLLASPFCPLDLVQTRVFIRRPIPYKPSPRGQIPVDAKYEAPTKQCGLHSSEQLPEQLPDEQDDTNIPDDQVFEQEEHNNDDEHGHENPLEGLLDF